ncbi:helix-turn-helix domain-containing protein [Nevskia ramosa]|uniref:helix-turn-helix domain-containing protein n=1 Tax=Nevskia ramosa TaxID=64002 RepID=UPI0003B480A5|nr:helix-turn-helix transcriptional regulator [Nevskia ramosa]
MPPLEAVPSESTGERIRRLRRARRMKQTAFATNIGCSQAELSRIESGDRPLTVSALGKIAAVLGVTPAALLS